MTTEYVHKLPLALLAASPFNPRRALDPEQLAELADSIRAQGMLQPIVVRPITDHAHKRGAELDSGACYQIVAGHRRVEAARLAGYDDVPAVVRAMTDSELRQAHLVENLQRVNLQALEEAEGYGRIRDDEGLTAKQIGERVGKKEGVVHNRLKLLDLCDAGKQALRAGTLGAEIAQLVARIPSEKLQTKALADLSALARNRFDPPSYRHCRELLIDKYTLRLSEAIFPRDDAELLPNAGACTTCVKRSGGDPHLFSDQLAKNARYGAKSGEQLCNDPDCFAAKKAEHLKRQAEKLAAKGTEVITGATARRSIEVQGRYNGPDKITVKGNDFVTFEDVKGKLKKAKTDVKPVVLQDPRTGKTAKAVRRVDLVAAGIKVAEPTSQQDRSAAERKREEERRAKRDSAAKAECLRRRQILDVVRSQIRCSSRSAFDLQIIARVAYAGVHYHGRELLAELWGEKNHTAMDKRIGQFGDYDLTLFALDCALVDAVHISAFDLQTHSDEITSDPLMRAAKHYSVDVAQFTIEDPAVASPGKAKQKKQAKKAAAVAADDQIEDGDLEMVADSIDKAIDP